MLTSLFNLIPTESSPQIQQSAVVSYPSVMAMYQEDIEDAVEYVGLPLLERMNTFQPRDIIAAYAGLGIGLCQNYHDMEKCRAEGLQLLSQHVGVQRHRPLPILGS